MNQIKFSHKYYKLDVIADNVSGGKHPVTLLEVILTHTSYLHPSFIEYDTTYFDGTQIQKYPLKTGVILILLFKDYKGNLFTTVRSRYGKSGDNLSYYMSKRGEEFEIVFTNVGAE